MQGVDSHSSKNCDNETTERERKKPTPSPAVTGHTGPNQNSPRNIISKSTYMQRHKDKQKPGKSNGKATCTVKVEIFAVH